MNAKAERIEQIVQIVNRNLQLVFAGQPEGVTPLEARQLQRIDTSIFGNDKFAYEMVHYVKMNHRPMTGSSITAHWDRNFFKGLETLLVECAVVKDEIERDCFVSRLYSWFTEKLVERRDLPRGIAKDNLDELKSSVTALGGVHTVKALDKYMKNVAATNTDTDLTSKSKKFQIGDADRSEQQELLHQQQISAAFDATRRSAVPLYVKHNYPNIGTNYRNDDDIVFGTTIANKQHATTTNLQHANKASSLSGPNYGLFYNEPQTEAEKGMHALFIAKRQQEAFEWKAKQQLALVLDRRALHLSRLESDALRRTESSSQISGQSSHPPTKPATVNTDNRFAPEIKRPFSAKRRSAARALGLFQTPTDINTLADDVTLDNDYVGEGKNSLVGLDTSAVGDVADIIAHVAADRTSADVEVTVTANGIEAESSTVPRPLRNAVMRSKKDKGGGKDVALAPMRFRHDLPENLRRNLERQRNYMQTHSDSESDEEESSRRRGPASVDASKSGLAGGLRTAPVIGLSSAQSSPVKLSASLPPPTPSSASGGRRVIRKAIAKVADRPAAAALLKEVVAHDNELQVLYRYSNFRRMAATVEMEKWVEERDAARAKKDSLFHAMLKERVAKASEKSSSKGKAKPKPTATSSPSKKMGKSTGNLLASKTMASDAFREKPKHYKSAGQFMATHFPGFDGQVESCGPMRTVQLEECDAIKEAFQKVSLPISEETLRRGLVIPQDRPESLCLENLREDAEGLMQNPLPVEYWRMTDTDKKKKKSKKTSKKKGSKK